MLTFFSARIEGCIKRLTRIAEKMAAAGLNFPARDAELAQIIY